MRSETGAISFNWLPRKGVALFRNSFASNASQAASRAFIVAGAANWNVPETGAVNILSEALKHP